MTQVFFDVDGQFRSEHTFEPEATWGQVQIWVADLIGIDHEDVIMYYGDELVEIYEVHEFRTHLQDGDTILVRWYLENGLHPLHEAAMSGNLFAARRWIVSGVEVDVQSDTRTTPLMYAANRNQVEMVEELIRHGADVNAQNMYGRTPLHWARRETYPLLIQAGADPTIQDENGTVPTMPEF